MIVESAEGSINQTDRLRVAILFEPGQINRSCQSTAQDRGVQTLVVASQAEAKACLEL